ncbi:broad substrate specificity ATP-binding cassette transporter ABCG2-like [Amphiura filiformis]|uniref:broad substrate specificity ATP-binding cassette transporter ABCG2-like n=1 Tax=Amphiura filiformis TaxID=82378 RepID=UPI003B221ACF
MSESSDTELSKLLPNNNARRYRAPRSASVVSFHNLHYSIQVKENKKKVEKIILNNVSGVFKSGLNAIMGPSGSGKTTLLDILASRKNPKGLDGTVLINGSLPHPNIDLMCGYVEQEDVVMGSLTVRENLSFCAALRLPGHYTKEQRLRRVNIVIAELDLHDCADTKVGMTGLFNRIRGVSGGERKRTCVGMELMIKPSILFLDEPTTGLDASTAKSVVQVLARLSQRGYTIIISIHQPRYDIFRLFNTYHLLSKGETVYHGPAGECLQYFNSIGFQCEKFDNPADYFLDVILNETSPSPLITRSYSKYTNRIDGINCRL